MEIRLKRMIAGFIDFSVICIFSTSLIGVITLGKLNVTAFSVITYVITFFVLLLIKDLIFRNASIGKKIFKLIVVKNDGTALRLVDIVKRNLSLLFLYPIEEILLLVNGQRLGDIWAKTDVIYE